METLYLINNVCNFIPLKKINFNEKKDIFSVSLFKLRNGSYKNFSRYLDGLKILNEISIENNLEIRLFIDNTIYKDEKIMNYLNNLETVTMILYECKNFKIDEYHVGLFGTLVRLFPLFDFENNDSRIVMIMDADLKKDDEISKKQIYLYKKIIENDLQNLIYFAYNASFFNKNTDNFLSYKNKITLFPYCLASSIIGCKKISKKLVYKFMSNLELYMDIKTRPTIILSDYIKSDENNLYNIRCENNICFGVDEYFINNGIIKYILKHELPFIYHAHISYAHINYNKHPNGVNKKSLSKEYREKFYKLMKDVNLDRYSYEELDKKLYKNDNENYKITDFMRDYVKKINQIIKYDNFIFNDVNKFYINELNKNNYYDLDFIRFFNIDKEDINIKYIKID